jgi:tRNA pseudouridine38-40 synthase
VKNYPDRTTLLIRFGYDGARFFGLQPQLDLPTAGAALAARLRMARTPTGEPTPAKALNFTARTDRGVHALGNLATCYFRGPLDLEHLLAQLATDHGDGLLAVSAQVVPTDVHARNVARGKHYRYRIRDRIEEVTPDTHAWLIHPTVNVDVMQQAGNVFLGTHDFSSLRASGCSAATPVKTITKIIVHSHETDVVIDVHGDAFLRKMVRNLVGLMVEVGTGWRSVDELATILAARDRRCAGICAPPEGLTLVAVGSSWPPDGSGLLPDISMTIPATRDGTSAL